MFNPLKNLKTLAVTDVHKGGNMAIPQRNKPTMATPVSARIPDAGDLLRSTTEAVSLPGNSSADTRTADAINIGMAVSIGAGVIGVYFGGPRGALVGAAVGAAVSTVFNAVRNFRK
jgi:hypothetical protein